MKKEPKGAKNRIVIAKDEKNVLTCTSEGFEYTPDIVKNVYGKSSRPALEDWFLTELDFFRRYYPGRPQKLSATPDHFGKVLP
ncbi:hypothetical protein, partial [Pseudomonas aeruginosa]|uniref:hypothetical protein n=1 Tax=Pseudomonas aeruginosa TaxID=287 RepID=UPI000AA37AE2